MCVFGCKDFAAGEGVQLVIILFISLTFIVLQVLLAVWITIKRGIIVVPGP